MIVGGYLEKALMESGVLLTFRKEKYLFATRLKVISKKCALLRFFLMMIESPSFLNVKLYKTWLVFIYCIYLINMSMYIYLYFVYIDLSLYIVCTVIKYFIFGSKLLRSTTVLLLSFRRTVCETNIWNWIILSCPETQWTVKNVSKMCAIVNNLIENCMEISLRSRKYLIWGNKCWPHATF